MRLCCLAVAMLLAAACNREKPQAPAEFVDAKTCAGCHPAQAKTYAQTGMGQSFRKATATEIEKMTGTYVHAPSDRTYQLAKRGDGFVMRRFQLAGGQETNVIEESIDYVVGSGHHARTFLHRTENNRL